MQRSLGKKVVKKIRRGMRVTSEYVED